MDNSLCASSFKSNNNIIIYDLDNLKKENIKFKAHLNNVNCIIKSNKNNIISLGDDGIIKIWPVITKNFLTEGKKYFNIVEEKKENIKTYGARKIININLIPLYEYKSSKDLSKIFKMISSDDNNRFWAASEYNIFLFEYQIDDNCIKLIFIKSYDIRDLIDIVLLKKDKEQILALCQKSYISFLNVNNFQIINKINIKINYKNCLLQISSNEILINNKKKFKIYYINKFKLKMKINKSLLSNYLLNLNDGTFIENIYYGIRRYSLKTMEIFPNLIDLENSNYETIKNLYKLKDGRIIVCYNNGNINILNLII